MQKGKFIVLEGIDGCGKTTIAKLLAKELGNALVTKEPTAASKKIQAVLKHRATAPKPLDFQKLYIADRLDHIKRVIVPALAKGKTVICQRYALSTFAYGMAFGVAEKDLQHDFLKPDLTILLHISVTEAMKRINSREQKTEYFERREMLKKIKSAYDKLIHKKEFGRIEVINAFLEPGVILGQICDKIESLR